MPEDRFHTIKKPMDIESYRQEQMFHRKHDPAADYWASLAATTPSSQPDLFADEAKKAPRMQP